MTDITDGLVIDLHSLLNGISALLYADSIPLRSEIKADPNALTRALYDGEDFELLFTASPQFTPADLTSNNHRDIYKLGVIRHEEGSL